MDRVKQFESSAELQLDLGGSHRFMKLILIGFNVLFFIFGCVLCGVGAYALNNTTQLLIGSSLPQGLIAVGAFLMFMAILGVLSAWKEWRLGLGIFFILLLLLSIILIAVGIAVYVERNQASNLMAQAWMAIGTADSSGIKSTLQASFNCYGGVAPTDPSVAAGTGCFCPGPSPYNNVTGATLPQCVPLLVSSFNSAFATAGGCGIAFAVIMLVCLAFVCFLMRGIKNKDTNQMIARSRARNEKELEKKRAAGKAGMKLDNVL